MQAKSFLFDLNKCVGCHACVVACIIENKTLPETQWRTINSYNPLVQPDIPLLHFSLACNHCQDPPCMKNCPALAFTKDLKTGTIQHLTNKCIGCKYCTWACPYDAPKFNEKTKIIEKCTFCNHRIENELKPACANLCPTGALDYIDRPGELEIHKVAGFTEIGIQPSIKIIPVCDDKPILLISENQNIIQKNIKLKKHSKITLKQEWPLVIFTLVASILVSVFTATIFTGLEPNPTIFVICGFSGMLLSLMHLGKKLRAWRAVLNLKNSWLSREIFFFGLFWFLSAIYFFIYQDNFIAYTGIVCGLFAMISIDKVYKVAIQPTRVEIHSAHVVLTYLLLTALFIGNFMASTFIIVIKSGLYIYRKIDFKNHSKNYRIVLTAWRLDMIISFPFLFWAFDVSNLFWWITASLILGEIIDRCEYYDELDVITPEKQIELDLKKMNHIDK